MSSHERATMTCEHNGQYVSNRRTVTDNKVKLKEVKKTLAQGYRSSQSCKEVEVGYDCVSTEETNASNGQEITKQKCVKNYVEKCVEVRETIDWNQEQSNRDKYIENISLAEKQASISYDRCYSAVINMTAEQAFSVYQEN